MVSQSRLAEELRKNINAQRFLSKTKPQLTPIISDYITSLYLELNGGHESHQNLWMTYDKGNFTGWQSLETITVLYISFLVILNCT